MIVESRPWQPFEVPIDWETAAFLAEWIGPTNGRKRKFRGGDARPDQYVRRLERERRRDHARYTRKRQDPEFRKRMAERTRRWYAKKRQDPAFLKDRAEYQRLRYAKRAGTGKDWARGYLYLDPETGTETVTEDEEGL